MNTDTPILLPASTLKRNRHTMENDEQTALIKRINRCYLRRGCDRKVRIVNGVPTLFFASSNLPTGRPDLPGGNVQALASIMNLDDYRIAS